MTNLINYLFDWTLRDTQIVSSLIILVSMAAVAGLFGRFLEKEKR